MLNRLLSFARFFVSAAVLTFPLSCTTLSGPAVNGGSRSVTGPVVNGGSKSVTEQLERTLEGKGVLTLDAQTTNGEIALAGLTQDGVVVRIRKEVRAPSEQEAQAFARSVQVFAERNGDGVRVYSVYPRPPANVQVSVAYDIQCPDQVAVKLATVNGAIRVQGVSGAVDAQTVNGNIDALMETLSGEGRFSAVNGFLDVQVRRGVAPVTATTLNGGVRVTLPASFSGQLDAQTLNGRASSDFPIGVPAGNSQNRLAGPVGGGGVTMIRLRATNGDVSLRRGQ
jgi:DUF4097 and DUF4098 domain-containing protein YvlB